MPLATPQLTKFTTASPFVFNIDYFDYATGAGYKKFYLFGTEDSVSKKYILTTNSSAMSATDNNEVHTTSTLNFDLTFNNPVTIANAPCTLNHTTVIAGAMTITIIWTIIHYDGATETTLGTVTTAHTGVANEYKKQAAQVTLTKKNFRVGDILRVKAAVTSTNAAARMFFDPIGARNNTATDTSTVTTTASVNIPFEVDL